jgi:nitrogen fixation protein FixH
MDNNPKPSATNRPNLWPVGILLSFGLFFAATICLVVVACSHRMDLVSPDYYEREIRFQEHIDRAQRGAAPASKPIVSYDLATRSISVSLKASSPNNLKGRIELYRPSAAALDRHFELQLTADGTQSLDAAHLTPGLWKVRLTWTVADQEFFAEQDVIVPPAVS